MVRPVNFLYPSSVNSKRVQPAENFILAMPGPNLSRLFQGAVSTGEEKRESPEVIETYGGPGVSRTRDLRFRKSRTSIENKVDQQAHSEDSGKVLQNPQPPRHKTERERRKT
jgi:hypothetical protein